MKKPALFLFLFTLCLLNCEAQKNFKGKRKRSSINSSSSMLRHAQGNKSFGGGYGIAQNGKYYQLEALYFIEQKTAVGVIASFNNGSENSIFYNRYELSPTFMYSPFNVNGLFYINGYAGLNARYETFGNKEKLAINDQFNIGFLLGGEGEIFIVKAISLYTYVRQDLMVFKPGRWRNIVGFGLRVSIK